MRPPQSRERGDKIDQPLVGILPIKPSRLVVLRICVVVAMLAAPELIACRQHGRATRHHQRSEQGSYVLATMLFDAWVWGCALHAVVPRDLLRRAIAIVLAVRQVMFSVMGNEIAQREAIVRRHV